MTDARVPASYFDDLYASERDPWGFESTWYEQRKYALTLAALPRDRYRRVFEPGCSIGVLTALLAQRTDEIVAWDPAPAAIEVARRRNGQAVRFGVASVPDDWPTGTFDLVVLSEVAYYFPRPELDDLLGRVMDSLEPGGDLVAVHWRLDTNYPLPGDEVHAVLRATPGLARLAAHQEREFVLDVLRREQ